MKYLGPPPTLSPMIRMALTHAVRWRRRCTPTGGVETVVAVGAPSRADGSFGWLRPWRLYINEDEVFNPIPGTRLGDSSEPSMRPWPSGHSGGRHAPGSPPGPPGSA